MVNVTVFDNPTYVDSRNLYSSESDNVQAFFTNQGHSVSTFTGIDAASINAATGGRDILVLPEFERGTPTFDAAAIAATSGFVGSGGSLFIYGGSGRQANFLNEVFGFSLSESRVYGDLGLSATASGTPWAGGPPIIPANNATEGLAESSLPVGSLSIYSQTGAAALAVIPFGAGSIIYVGWDWFNGAPVGSADNGWGDVVSRAVTFVETGFSEVNGTTGNDPGLVGTASSDRVKMLEGDDVYTKNLVGDGADLIDGGEGGEVIGDKVVINDTGATARSVTLFENAGYTAVNSGNLRSASMKDVEHLEINLAGGNDVASVGAGLEASGLESVTVSLGAGNDLFNSGSSTVAVRVFGEAGSDIIAGGAGADIADGGSEFDLFSYRSATVGAFVDLNNQSNNAHAAAGDMLTNFESIFLTDENDQISGPSSSIIIFGFGGNDIMQGSGQSDIFEGGQGGDYMDGGAGLDSAYYSTATTGVVIDRLDPGRNTGDAAGDYFVSIEGYSLTAYGDSFEGADPLNFVYGLGGADQMFGSVNSNDWFFGGDGNDFLAGGTWNDRLEGGDGSDIFAFADFATGGLDTIVDFDSGQDRLQLTGPNFGGLAAGTVLVAGQNFIVGSLGLGTLNAATNAATLLYDYATGLLYFDADGTGAGGPGAFAQLSGLPGLAASDFDIVGLG